jgi:hypothetical protein
MARCRWSRRSADRMAVASTPVAPTSGDWASRPIFDRSTTGSDFPSHISIGDRFERTGLGRKRFAFPASAIALCLSIGAKGFRMRKGACTYRRSVAEAASSIAAEGALDRTQDPAPYRLEKKQRHASQICSANCGQTSARPTINSRSHMVCDSFRYLP